MFCQAAIEVLFNLKAAQRRRDSREGGRTRRGKLIPFLWASDKRDVRSDLGSRRTPVQNSHSFGNSFHLANGIQSIVTCAFGRTIRAAETGLMRIFFLFT